MSRASNWILAGLTQGEGGPIEVGTVYGIGRNYSEHAKELGNAVPTSPVVFLKPRSSVSLHAEPIQLPTQSTRVDHEVEMVAVIGKTGRNIPRERALTYIAGYAVGIDVTARDLQETAKKGGLPWAIAKGFESFAPISRFVPAGDVKDPAALSLELTVNGEKRQSGSTADMLFDLPELVHFLSTIFRLEPGDLIFTGTPSGVGPLKRGDRLVATLGAIAKLECEVIN